MRFDAFLKQYFPQGDRSDSLLVLGYVAAEAMVEVLRRCGDDLTRANVMKQAASLRDVELEMLLPGIKINTSVTDYAPIKQMQMMRFEGVSWHLIGGIIDGGMQN